MKVYVLMVDVERNLSGGGLDLVSVHSTREGAEAEFNKMKEKHPKYYDQWAVVEKELLE